MSDARSLIPARSSIASRFWTYLELRKSTGLQLLFAYLLLLGVSAWLGHWTPEYLAGRTWWHFAFSRMVVPMIALGAIAAWARLVPASLLLSSVLLAIGAVSAIKREALGEPFQVSDLFLASQGGALLGYVPWDKWLIGATVAPAAVFYIRNIRFRWWSIPLFVICLGLLSTYRIDGVVKFVHDYLGPWGVNDLPFNQAESERMNGIATHLYFSTAGIRVMHYKEAEMDSALASLDAGDVQAPVAPSRPDIYIILGEAWWRDPSDAHSPLDELVKAGFIEGSTISPVYGGTTPNAEFEVLTGIPIHSFKTGIIPYQHYVRYFAEPHTLPRLLQGRGYTSRAYHNHDRRFWLRDQVYPRFGFESFDGAEGMQLTLQSNGWAKDDALYTKVLEREASSHPQFHFLITVATHGPFAEDALRDAPSSPGVSDYRDRLAGAVTELLAFEKELRRRGTPFVLLVFGDHLPGLRLHQLSIGITETDPRLHQIPFLIASTEKDAGDLRDHLNGRPLYCMSPLMTDWLQLGMQDRYYRYVTKACRQSTHPDLAPAEPVIQHQLFTAGASPD